MGEPLLTGGGGVAGSLSTLSLGTGGERGFIAVTAETDVRVVPHEPAPNHLIYCVVIPDTNTMPGEEIVFISGSNAKVTEELCQRLNTEQDVTLPPFGPSFCPAARAYARARGAVTSLSPSRLARSLRRQAKYLLGKYKFLPSALGTKEKRVSAPELKCSGAVW